MLRLIRKREPVGVIEENRLPVSETGAGRGQEMSPHLANIAMHHVLDDSFKTEVKPC